MKCQMNERCSAEVTMIDPDGYLYCTGHGVQRRLYKPCRKLRTYELNKLARGEQIARY